MGTLKNVKDMAFKAKDFGSRIRKKGQEFVDRVTTNRNNVQPIKPQGMEPDWDCVGPCLDDNGNPVWIPMTQQYVNLDDLRAAWGKGLVDEVEQDPLMAISDSRSYVSDDIRKDFLGRILSSGSWDDYAKEKGLKKVQKVEGNGKISRRIALPNPVEDAGNVQNLYGSRIQPIMNRKIPWSMKNKKRYEDEVPMYTGDFTGSNAWVDPRKVSKDDVRRMKREGYLPNAKLTEMKKDDTRNILENDVTDLEFMKKRNRKILDKKDRSNVANSEARMNALKVQADNKRAEKLDPKWDAIVAERKAAEDKKIEEYNALAEQLEKLRQEWQALKESKYKAMRGGEEREADRAKLYKYPDLR